MNKIYLSFFLLFFTAFSYGQIIVLDSIVTTERDNGVEQIVKKNIFTYDATGREIRREDYRLLVNTTILFNSQTISTVYNGNEVEKITQRTSSASVPLENRFRLRYFYENQGDYFTELFNEEWDSSLGEFIPYSKTIATLHHATNRQEERFFWVDSIGDYQLNGVNDFMFDGLSVIETISFLDSTGLSPGFRDSKIFDDQTEVQVQGLWEYYLDDNQEWKLVNGYYIDLDYNAFTGTRKSYNNSTGVYPRDSSIVSYNASWQPSLVLAYLRLDNGEYIRNGKIEYDYTADEYLSQITSFDSQNTSINFTEKVNYYYSTLDVVTAIPTAALALELHYPNPSPPDGIIRIQTAEEINTFSLLITDALGKTVVKEQVLNKKFMELSDFQLSSGLYYLTLLKEQEKKTWKIVIH